MTGVVLFVLTVADAQRVQRDIDRRLTDLAQRARTAPVIAAISVCGSTARSLRAGPDPLMASWRSVGGCGAGSATATGGIKWIGRNVTGGLINVQCQVNYTHHSDGHVYALQNQITSAVGERWTFGAVVPYLYKYLEDPFGLRFDLSNQGLGDINLLAARRLGPIGATTLTLTVGLPTGTHAASYLDNYLRQDRQLGLGKPSASLLVDHVLDHLWGPAVVGGVLSHPGGENQLENYRAPSGTVYGFLGYLLGPLVPAIGVSGTAFWGADRDRGRDSAERPAWMVSGNVSLEWSTDWAALLVGASLPYHSSGLQPWTAGVGVAVSAL
jgi:hypothetical protein